MEERCLVCRENDAAGREEIGCGERGHAHKMWCDREGCTGREEMKTDDLLG